MERQRLGLETPERGSEGCLGPRHALREAYERYVVPLSSQRPALFPEQRCSLQRFTEACAAVATRSFNTAGEGGEAGEGACSDSSSRL